MIYAYRARRRFRAYRGAIGSWLPTETEDIMDNIQRAFLMVLLLAILNTPFFPASAQTPPAPEAPLPTGEEIIKKSKDLLYQIDDQKNKVTLKLIDKNASAIEIVAQRYWKNYKGADGFSSKTVIFTESPADSRGQAILIWDHTTEGKAEDLWIFLPSLRNTRRLLPQQQDEAFMGSDLSFADMGQRRLDEDTHEMIREEVYKGIPCFIVESAPKDKESPYSKKVSWVSKGDYTIQKIDYYDRNGKMLKRQTIDWQSLKDKGNSIFVWKKTEVVNVQKEHKTIFEVSELKINTGLADADFTERVLTRGLKR